MSKGQQRGEESCGLDGKEPTGYVFRSARLTEDVQRILVESFPPDELDDLGALASAVAQGKKRLFLGGDDGVAAVAVLHDLGFRGATCLEYLAVAPGQRSRGIGGRVLEHVLGIEKQRGTERLVLELEPISVDAHNAAQREARLRFYARHGAIPIEFDPGYQAPNFVDGSPLDYLLLEFLIADHARALDPSSALRLARALLAEVYGLADEHPMMKRLETARMSTRRRRPRD